MAYRMQSSAPELMDLSQRAEGDSRPVRRRAGQDRRSPTIACWPAGWSSAASASCSSSTRRGTTTATSSQDLQGEVPEDRPGLRRPGQGPEAARAARRHAGHLGRRVRPHARWSRGATTAATITPTPSRCGWPAAASSRASRYGATDDLGFNAVEDRVHVHDLHATILHLLGFDHTKLTYRFQGRDFRLTDVSGEVVTGMLA